MSPALAGVLVAVVGFAITVALQLVLRWLGKPSVFAAPAERQRAFWALMALMAAAAGVAAWALNEGQPALGLGVLVAVWLIPQIVILARRR